MKVCTTAVNGRKSETLIKVAEKIVSEYNNLDFSVIYTTVPVNEKTIKEIKNILNCPFIGCYTEGIIYDGKLVNGAGAMAISGIKAITEMSRSPSTIGKRLSIFSKGSIITFMSWLTENISSTLRVLYNYLSYNFSYFGACTGNFYERKSIQFTEKGIENAICSAGINTKMCVAFDHGWKVMKGPFMISKYFGNRIYELDDKKAMDVYCSVVECCKNNFDECRKKYPFGFLCACGKYKLRSPLEYYRDGSIKFLGEIPRGSVTFIMKCEEEEIVDAAERAARSAIHSYGEKARFAMVVDCIARKQLLKKKFNDELKRINEAIDIPYIGMLSIGEIFSTSRVYVPSFHNKTVAVAVGGD